MEPTLEGADAVHRVSDGGPHRVIHFTRYTAAEGEYSMPWVGGKIDGRALKKRDKRAVKINGIDVHALGNESGMIWDCVNGFRPAKAVYSEKLTTNSVAESQAPVVSDSGDSSVAPGRDSSGPSQAYALRIWNGQSVDVSIPDRVERVVNGLRGQGLIIAVTLPHPDAARYLAKHA